MQQPESIDQDSRGEQPSSSSGASAGAPGVKSKETGPTMKGRKKEKGIPFPPHPPSYTTLSDAYHSQPQQPRSPSDLKSRNAGSSLPLLCCGSSFAAQGMVGGRASSWGSFVAL
jgi:hypothetical protein